MSTITTSLWFDTEAEEAARFYTSVVKNSAVQSVTRTGDGKAFVVSFTLDGQQFSAMNAGPQFRFTEAVSVTISCEGQDEVDSLWARLSDGGEEGPCGWLKDRYGLSWQVVPTALQRLMGDPDPEKASRVSAALQTMKKIDIKALEDAHAQP